MTESSKANPVIWDKKIKGVDTITHLYNRLASIFLDRWHKNFPDDVSIQTWKMEWSQGLKGFSVDEIQRAIQSCHNISWPPTLGDFRNLCRPCPDYETLFNEAAAQVGRHAASRKWTSRAAYHAATVYGHFELKNATWSAARTRWTKIIDELRAIGNLDPIPEYHEALPAPGRTTPDMKRINHYLADLHRLIGNTERAKELGQ